MVSAIVNVINLQATGVFNGRVLQDDKYACHILVTSRVETALWSSTERKTIWKNDDAPALAASALPLIVRSLIGVLTRLRKKKKKRKIREKKDEKRGEMVRYGAIAGSSSFSCSGGW